MSSLINFAKRHKKKLIFTIVFFGGGYCGVKYSIRKLQEFLIHSATSSSLAKEQLISIRKTEHYLSIKQTSDHGVLGLIKSMQAKINDDLSSAELLEQLKHKPANKLAIWETLKIKCITRCFVSIYATTLLTLFTKIELNIIGAYLFLSNSDNPDDQLDNNNTDDQWSSEFIEQQQEHTLSSNVQQEFLNNIENFVNNGLARLTHIVETHSEEVFGQIGLKESLSVEEISEKLREIREKIEGDLFETDGELAFLSKYMLPDLDVHNNQSSMRLSDNYKKIKSDDEVLRSLNLETYDILTSADFYLCSKTLVDLFTNEYIDTLTGQIVQQLVPTEFASDQSIEVKMPFARLIPILNIANEIFERNSVKNKMLNDANLSVFCANVYEAFSVPHKTSVTYDYGDSSMDITICKNSMLNQVL